MPSLALMAVINFHQHMKQISKIYRIYHSQCNRKKLGVIGAGNTFYIANLWINSSLF